MEKFVKNFIGMSIVYLGVSMFFGVAMLVHTELIRYRFVHSHLMMLGWVSMMIYGVGYHILPRFVGKLIKSVRLGVLQFWLSNIGLVGMLGAYALETAGSKKPVLHDMVIFFGLMNVAAIAIFFYNMMGTLYGPPPAE